MIDRKISQTFARGIAVLRILNERNGATAREVGKLARIHEVIARRLLDTMVHEGLAHKAVRSGQYWLAPQIHALSSGYVDDRWIRELAAPKMNRLGRQVVWPISLTTPRGLNLIVRMNTDEYSPLTMRKTPIGAHYPLLASASGPAYLAFCDDQERESIAGLLWSTDRQQLKARYVSKAALLTSLMMIRRRGYSLFDGDDRTSAVAVPVSHDNRAVAALTLRYFTVAMTPREAVKRYLPLMLSCAADIGRGLAGMR